MKERVFWFADRWAYTQAGLGRRGLTSGSLQHWFSQTIVNAVTQETSHLKERGRRRLLAWEGHSFPGMSS